MPNKSWAKYIYTRYLFIIRLKCSRTRVWRILTCLLPIVEWLPKYKFREDLVPDAIAGITVGVMHIPQGMAYASLAGVDPVYGLYTSFWPSLFYTFFGTTRHVSLGIYSLLPIPIIIRSLCDCLFNGRTNSICFRAR